MSALFVNDGYTINATIEFANGKVERYSGHRWG